MYNIRSRWSDVGGNFKDVSALGIFVDNHDNARFLNSYNNKAGFKSALTFALTATGIPFYYYGSEQAYAGGNDPQNRESLWQDINTGSDIYKMTAAINKARKAGEIWNHQLEEKYVMDNVYCFSRGSMMVATTNRGDQVSFSPSTSWSEGT